MNKKALIRKKLRTLKVDGILVTDLLNVKYLTGFTGSAAYVIISQNDALFITDFRYQEQAKHEVKGYKIVIERGERSKEIKDLAGQCGIKRLGFEDHNVVYAFYKKLLKKNISLKPLTETVESLRIIKTPDEIGFIRKAVKRAESAFRRLQPFIKTGTTERKLALKFEELLKEEGCKTIPFGVIVASGFMSALPHARPTNRVIRKGDFIVFDWGGEYKGYYSDMTRTVVMKGGNVARQREIYEIVLDAQEKAIDAVGSNRKAADVDAGARNHIKHKRYEEYFGHGTGHGVGLAVHEKPSVSWRSKDVIKENMVFTVEPGIYLPRFGGVRIEDMVVVTKAGAELLTSLPKKFRVI